MIHPAVPVRRPVLGAMLAVVAALVVVLAQVPTAAAHGGEGVLEPVSVTTTEGAAEVSVRLTYESDGHTATDATVTVAGTGDGGAVLTPLVLGHEGDGVYTGTVDLPAAGTWDLRVTAVTPPAQLDLPVTAGAEPVTAGAAESTATTAAPTTDQDGTSPDEDPDTPGGVPTLTDEDAPGDDDGGTDTWVWVVGGLAALVAVGLGVVFVLRGRRPGPID